MAKTPVQAASLLIVPDSPNAMAIPGALEFEKKPDSSTSLQIKNTASGVIIDHGGHQQLESLVVMKATVVPVDIQDGQEQGDDEKALSIRSIQGSESSGLCESILSHGSKITDTSSKASSVVEDAVDQNLRDAFLQPRYRIFLLRLEQELRKYVSSLSAEELVMPAASPYERLLTHKLAELFRLEHITDARNNCVKVYKSQNTKIPSQSLAQSIASEPVEVQKTLARPHILRRDVSSNVSSDFGSDGTQSPDLKLLDNCKEDHSLSRSSSTARSQTMEEKTANYEAIKARIFADFGTVSLEKKLQSKQRRVRVQDDDFSARSSYQFIPGENRANLNVSPDNAITGNSDLHLQSTGLSFESYKTPLKNSPPDTMLESQYLEQQAKVQTTMDVRSYDLPSNQGWPEVAHMQPNTHKYGGNPHNKYPLFPNATYRPSSFHQAGVSTGSVPTQQHPTHYQPQYHGISGSATGHSGQAQYHPYSMLYQGLGQPLSVPNAQQLVYSSHAPIHPTGYGNMTGSQPAFPSLHEGQNMMQMFTGIYPQHSVQQPFAQTTQPSFNRRPSSLPPVSAPSPSSQTQPSPHQQQSNMHNIYPNHVSHQAQANALKVLPTNPRRINLKTVVKAPMGVEVDGVMYYDRKQKQEFEAMYGPLSR